MVAAVRVIRVIVSVLVVVPAVTRRRKPVRTQPSDGAEHEQRELVAAGRALDARAEVRGGFRRSPSPKASAYDFAHRGADHVRESHQRAQCERDAEQGDD